MADKPGVPEFWFDPAEQARKNAQVANQLQKGQANNSRKVTLEPDATETVISISFVRANHIAIFSPQDQATATAIAAGAIWAETSNGRVTITHDSSPDSRTLGLTVHG